MNVAVNRPHEEPEHFADRLLARCAAVGAPTCVGLDPVVDRLPDAVAGGDGAVAAIERFCTGVVEAVAPIAAAVKLQSACFERYGSIGLGAAERVTRAARDAGLVVIGDVKRGDIGVSSGHYAAACFEPGIAGPHDSASGMAPRRGYDAATVHTWLGVDGIRPFLVAAAPRGGGVFALVRTSNPGGDAIQSLRLASGPTVAEHVASLVAEWGGEPGSDDGMVGESGYSLLGAVVGVTKSAEAAKLRDRMPRQILLLPGYGAQGGGADELRPFFDRSGQGALVTASRSVIFAFESSGEAGWQKSIADAARRMRDDVAGAIGS